MPEATTPTRRHKHPGKQKTLLLLLLTALAIFGALPSPCHGFLGRGSWLEGYGDVFGIYCRDFSAARTRVWHHREVVREGVRRAMVNYYEETPPRGRVYNHRVGMTLEESYAEYHGETASSRRFLEAVEALVDATVEAGGEALGNEARYHFNDEQFSQSQEVLEDRWRRLVGAAHSGDVTAARYMLGLSLAAVQDFYAHSNWLELGYDTIKPDLGLPGATPFTVAGAEERTCEDCSPTDANTRDCRSTLSPSLEQTDSLTSDYITAGRNTAVPPGKCVLVRPAPGKPQRSGIGKDLPSSCYSARHDLHEAAAELASQATSHYLTTLRKTIGDKPFLLLLSVSPTPAVAVVVASVSSSVFGTKNGVNTQVSESVMQALQRLHEKHDMVEFPPEEYLLVTEGGTSARLTRSSNPATLIQAYRTSLTNSRAGSIGGLPLNPLTMLRTVAHVCPPGCHVIMLVESGGVGNVRWGSNTVLTHVQALLENKNIVVTPIVLSQASVTRDPRLWMSMQMTGESSSPASHDSVPDVEVLSGDEDDDVAVRYSYAGNEDDDANSPSVEQNEPSEGNLIPKALVDTEIEVMREIMNLEDDSKHSSRSQDTPERLTLSERLIRRQIGTGATSEYQSLSYLAIRSGSNVVDASYGALDEVMKLVSMDQHSEAILHRHLAPPGATTAPLPLDRHLRTIRVLLHGRFHDAQLTSHKGAQIDLLSSGLHERVGVTTHISSPFFTLVEVDVKHLADTQGLGTWSLSYTPDTSTSTSTSTTFSMATTPTAVTVKAVTPLDVTTTFHRAATDSLQPSLLRLQGQPSQDYRHFVNLAVTGIDTHALQRVSYISFMGIESGRTLAPTTPLLVPSSTQFSASSTPFASASTPFAAPLNTTEPRRNSYFRLDDKLQLPRMIFEVVYSALDDQSHPLIRHSHHLHIPAAAQITFPSGREVWGREGSVLVVPFTVTNTLPGGAVVFTLMVEDVLRFPMRMSRSSVSLSSNESASVTISITIPASTTSNFYPNVLRGGLLTPAESSALKRWPTNTLVVSASPVGGGGGQSSVVAAPATAVAHLVVSKTSVRPSSVDATDSGHLHEVPDDQMTFFRIGLKGGKMNKIVISSVRDDGDGAATYNEHDKFKNGDYSASSFTNTANKANLGHRTNAFDIKSDNLNMFRRSSHAKMTYKDNPTNLGIRSEEGTAEHKPDNEEIIYNLDSLLPPLEVQQDSEPEFQEYNRDIGDSESVSQEEEEFDSKNIEPRSSSEIKSPIRVRDLSGRFGANPARPLTLSFQGEPQRMRDKTPPYIEILSSSSCGDFQGSNRCAQQEWGTQIKVGDNGSGLSTVTTSPPSQVPNFVPGTREIALHYTASCCSPGLTIFATDMYQNHAQRVVGDTSTLGAGAITGIVIASVVLLILIIIGVIFGIRRCNSKDKVELRSRRAVRSNEK